MGEFDGKLAIVTGGASGIGAATVARLRDDGARVVAADIDTRFLVDADRPGIEILELELRESGLEKDAVDLAWNKVTVKCAKTSKNNKNLIFGA